MIDILYEAIRGKIKADLPGVKWVDLDSGQLDNPEQNYVFPFPAIFIDFPNIDWQDAGERMQDGDVQVTLRVAFRIFDETHGNTTDTQYDTFTHAMDALKLMTSIHAKLQGFSDGESFNRLSRITTNTQRREDGLKVFEMIYVCQARDKSAMKEYNVIQAPTVTIREAINKSHVEISAVTYNLNPDIGSKVTVKFSVENSGTDTAHLTTVAITQGDGLQFDSCTFDGDDDYDPLTGTWTIGNIEAAKIKELYLTVKVLETGSYNVTGILHYAEQPNPSTHSSDFITIVPVDPES